MAASVARCSTDGSGSHAEWTGRTGNGSTAVNGFLAGVGWELFITIVIDQWL
ncbi:MAG: hypothetical protein ACP5P9_10300 [Acidimicrobiales bacterium]